VLFGQFDQPRRAGGGFGEVHFRLEGGKTRLLPVEFGQDRLVHFGYRMAITLC